MDTKAAIIIPARYASSRFPGKSLALIRQKPMIQWVYERCAQVRRAQRVIVATDSKEIYSTVETFGGEAMFTSSTHRSGTDRVAELAEKLDCDTIVNVQGDEPLIEPAVLDASIAWFVETSRYEMGTLGAPIKESWILTDPNRVKVQVSGDRALSFSRQMERFPQNAELLLHIGVYLFRKHFLLRFVSLPPSPNEMSERLEQLRALDNGHEIGLHCVNCILQSVDVPSDIEKVEALLEGR